MGDLFLRRTHGKRERNTDKNIAGKIKVIRAEQRQGGQQGGSPGVTLHHRVSHWAPEPNCKSQPTRTGIHDSSVKETQLALTPVDGCKEEGLFPSSEQK